MSLDDSIAGSWAMLRAALSARQAVRCWSAREPALAAATTIDDLAMLTDAGAPPGQANAVLGALVRIAARAGGDDPDAVLVIIHLLSNGLCASAARLTDAVPDALPHLVAEVASQVRCWPICTVYRSYATLLLRTAERAVLAERYPRCVHGRRVRETPLDPTGFDDSLADRVLLSVDPTSDDPAADRDVDPIHLVRWALRSAVICRDDVELLLDVEASFGDRGASLHQVATRRQVSIRTLYRRRRQAEAALRAAVPAYVNSCAA